MWLVREMGGFTDGLSGLLQAFEGDGGFCGFGYEALEDFAWAELYEVICTISKHVDDTLGPADRRCELGE